MASTIKFTWLFMSFILQYCPLGPNCQLIGAPCPERRGKKPVTEDHRQILAQTVLHVLDHKATRIGLPSLLDELGPIWGQEEKRLLAQVSAQVAR